MAKLIVKIGHQKQANKAIFLLPSGEVECGNFKYNGRYKKKFKDIYLKILDIAYTKPQAGVIDVSYYKYWNAIHIYDEYVVAKWIKTISARRIEKFAQETAVFLLLEEIRTEFKRSVDVKWKKIFQKSDANDPETPRSGWQIL
jgi:hypothetical protein